MSATDLVSTKIAQYLLEIKAIKLRPDDPFTWTSGWRSPIYNDNRVILSFPVVRNFVKEHLAILVREHFPEAEVIAGVATAGIAPGALVADGLQLSFAYVRPEPKKHGMGNQIEGRIEAGQKCVVVEDLISTGKSSLAAVEALRAAGVEVMGLVSIFTYGFDKASEAFKEANLPYYSLCNYDAMIDEAVNSKYVREEQVSVLKKWRESPSTWMQ